MCVTQILLLLCHKHFITPALPFIWQVYALGGKSPVLCLCTERIAVWETAYCLGEVMVMENEAGFHALSMDIRCLCRLQVLPCCVSWDRSGGLPLRMERSCVLFGLPALILKIQTYVHVKLDWKLLLHLRDQEGIVMKWWNCWACGKLPLFQAFHHFSEETPCFPFVKL